MRLLDRYLLRELLVPLGYCLGGFLLFWIAFDLFAELSLFQRKGLNATDILDYYLVTTPEFLILVLPIALLLALLYALTNHARHHEITAIRAAGVSLWRLCMPYFLVGFLMSVAALAINELWVPQSSEAAQQILSKYQPDAKMAGPHQVRYLGFANTRDGRIWQIPVYDWEAALMTGPEIFWTEKDGTRMRLVAETGGWTNNMWVFGNATLYREAAQGNPLPEKVAETNAMAMPSFSETPELVKSEIKVSKSLVIGQAKRADLAMSEIQNYLRLHPNPSASDAAWLNTKLQGRMAAPWTCLVVTLIAIPFGAASGRRNVFVGVASSIVICFVFFVLQQFGLALGTGGYLPPWVAAWLPNMVFGLAGLGLTATAR